MKETVIALYAILAVATARVVINIEGQDTPHLLGAKACTWGPSYWCQNLTTAAGCNATKHCIPKVWEKMQVPEDHDSVCQVCKDMVQQARDQLESNQTQEDLKAVFEGSCALIYIKPIVKECDKLVDQFIPELVETLASQMNPSVVCSVAGLCNSAHIDKLLEEYTEQSQNKKLQSPISLNNDEYTPDECTKCYTIAHHMEQKFGQKSRDSVLEQLLNVCGQFSSFSDACSSIVLTNFETIYFHLKNNLNAPNVCHLSGQCSAKFHTHEDESTKTPEVEIRPLSSVGMVEIGDDLPCKLCEQLVAHLRDLLVANTTETEFQTVLEGLCKQTKSFAPECKAIVDEYYPQIYAYLTKGLNGNAICQMGGLCPAPGKKVEPIWPLVPESHARIAVRIMNEKNSEPKSLDASEMQLPIELTMPLMGLTIVDDKYCSSCEFVMNYVKQNVRDLKDQDEVKIVLDEVKSSLPAIKGEPVDENFLTKYEMALAELIRQGRDLSEICSLVAACPTNQQIEAWERIPSEFVKKSSIEDKPNCPLCLFAVSKLYDLVKDDKTEASIEAALDKLCNELPKSLNGQCVDLVKIYSKELIQLLLNDMSPQEVCAYIKLCDPPQDSKPQASFGEKIIAVPKNDVEGKEACALCEYVLHYLQQAITNPKAEDEVKQVINKVCTKLPKSIRNDCSQFIDTYGDALVSILAQQIDPSEVCPMIHICPSAQLLESWKEADHKEEMLEVKLEEKPNCPLCLFGVTQLYNAIKDNKTEASIEAALEKLCIHLPQSLTDQCETLVKNYSKQIIEMILADLTPQEVCVYLQLCDPNKNVEPTISFFPLDADGEIMTNEIPDYPQYVVNNEKSTKVEEDAECVICEFVMQYVEKAMSSRKTKDEIEHMIHGVCNHLPKHMSEKCNNFVNEYAEIVIELLAQEVSPKEICTIVDLCKPDTRIQEFVAECAICQAIVTTVEKLLVDPKTGENIEEVMTKVCKYLPTTERGKCTMLMEIYEQSFIDIIKAHGDTRKICSKLSLCSSNDFLVRLVKSGRNRRQVDDKNLGTKPCTWGISYWCVDDKTAEECKATELCKKKGILPDASSTTIKAAETETRDVASEAEQSVSQDAADSSSNSS
ncbi:uncharacterized protein LOC100119722 [Nasonia vitripennis]|uniref:Uncharacterized protein n=1 Tax=Nasonia vitripennis TaxID=7425 RepID=A0A7M7G8H0_NASVI|nr:uncharacterized protein LOC100119722 [Nasonia vitripennis]